MKYQLVIQFTEKLEGGFERLIEIEDELIEKLSTDAEVDGHDFGSGQMNIFVLTNQPLETFKQIIKILTSWKDTLTDMKAAYRNVEGEDYTCVWPNYLTEFNVT